MNINLTIIGQSISFIIFVWFCLKFIWPPVIGALRERQRQIARGLEQSAQAEQTMEQARQESLKLMEETRTNAQGLIEQAHRRADQLIEQAKQQAVVEGDQLKEAAQAEIERELNRAREELRGQVSELAIAGAEKILQASVDRTRHNDLLRQLAAEL